MNHDDKLRFMQMAVELAMENLQTGKGGPFGAVIVKDGVVVGKGSNSVTSTNDPTAHAEVNAIRDACKNLGSFQLDDCIVFTSCEPCPMCLGAIYWARPEAVYYASNQHDAADAGFDDSFIYKEIELPYEKRSIPFVHQPTDFAQSVFDCWKIKEDKVDY